MSDNRVEFDTDVQVRQQYAGKPGSMHVSAKGGDRGGLTGWLTKMGIANDERGAKVILIVIICVNFLIAAAVTYFFVLT
jgi:hypothetical protein